LLAAPAAGARAACAALVRAAVDATTETAPAGTVVVAWTVDRPDDLARVDAAGVDAVVTNDPRIFTPMFVSTLET